MNPAKAYLSRMLPSAEASQRSALRRAVLILSGGPGDPEEFPWVTVTHDDLTRLRAQLVSTLAPRTVNRHLCAVRQVLTELWADDQLDGHALERFKHVLKSVRARQLARGRVLADRELEDLFRVCMGDGTPAGPRDAAMLSLLAGCGLRRQEIATLDVGNVQLDGQLVKVEGKGRAARVVFMNASVLAWMRIWIKVRGGEDGALFPPIRAKKIRPGRISPSAVWHALRKRVRQAGLARGVSPHDCRRTRATRLLQHGVDLGVVGRTLGHVNLSTTLLYDQRGRVAEAQAAELVPLPLPGDLVGGGTPHETTDGR